MSDKEMVIGKIEALYADRNAAWNAYFKSEYRLDELQDEIAKLKEQLRRDRGTKKQRKLATWNVPEIGLRKQRKVR